MQWNIIQQEKRSDQASKRHEEILKADYSMKEANLKSLRAILFQLHNIQEKTKL